MDATRLYQLLASVQQGDRARLRETPTTRLLEALVDKVAILEARIETQEKIREEES